MKRLTKTPVFSLFVPMLRKLRKKVEKELPKDELWQLYCAAYEQYQSEIINGEKSYSRYVNDLYYYHLPAMNMSESDARVHIMNVCGLKELLENRRDLVDAFFSKDKFEEKDYQQISICLILDKALLQMKTVSHDFQINRLASLHSLQMM